MADTKVVYETPEGHFTTELQEALSIVAGKYGATVALPCAGVTDEVLRQLNALMNPIGSRVRRDVWIGHVDGKRRMLDLLRFEPTEFELQIMETGRTFGSAHQ